MRHHVLVALAALSLPLATPAAHAQIRASELQTIAQTVDGTTLTLTYSRPRTRGRWPIFGTRAVQWGEVWTPGANWATTLQVNKDISIAGKPVPKGKYGIWMVVSQDSTWTMLLDPKWQQFHMDHPKPNETQIHVPVHADTTAPLEEALTWSFPTVTSRGGTMAMHWAKTRVTMPFTVQPSLSELLPESEAKTYLGTYLITDAKSKEQSKLILTYARGGLKARFDPEDKYMQTFALMKTGPGIFTAGLYESAEVYAGGEIYEVLKPDMMFTFTVKDGVVTVECRGDKDELYFSGRRQP
jgi:hypothetical protein